MRKLAYFCVAISTLLGAGLAAGDDTIVERPDLSEYGTYTARATHPQGYNFNQSPGECTEGDCCNGDNGEFNCHCHGSYNYPVPPQYTYHWPGIYSWKTMINYGVPWQFPPIAGGCPVQPCPSQPPCQVQPPCVGQQTAAGPRIGPAMQQDLAQQSAMGEKQGVPPDWWLGRDPDFGEKPVIGPENRLAQQSSQPIQGKIVRPAQPVWVP